ncbi:MAG: copper resistance D family protein [Nocardioides sp.]
MLLLTTPPPPSLGPIRDGVLTGAMWISLMAVPGLLALAAFCARPAADPVDRPAVLARLARLSVVGGVLAVPLAFLDLAHGLAEDGGMAIVLARQSLYDGTVAGLLLGLELSLVAAAVMLVLPLTSRRTAASSAAPWLLAAGLAVSVLALGTTRFPDERPEPGAWGRTVFSALMWLLHLEGGAIWIGGLIGLAALTVPGVVSAEHRRRFWSRTLRRFAVVAMTCVAAIVLSGIWLYWTHVDGPSQLLTTLYGRVLGVKILIVGAMLALGAANQFWLHPRIERLREAGDERPLRVILAKEFPLVITVEALLGMAVLMVAPFLHGSARGEVFAQEQPAAAAAGERPEQKTPSAGTWVYGAAETGAVVVFMVGAYRVSGRLARRRSAVALSGWRPGGWPGLRGPSGPRR